MTDYQLYVLQNNIAAIFNTNAVNHNSVLYKAAYPIPDIKIVTKFGDLVHIVMRIQSVYSTPGLFARMIRAEICMSRLPKAKIYNIISCNWMYTNEYTEQIKDIHMPNNFEPLYKALVNLRKKTK